MQKPLAQQLQEARERAGLNKTELGRRIGWASHSNVVRIEEGRNIESTDLVRWAELCDHEVLVVPAGSTESVSARLVEADERERRLAASLLDLLREARGVLPALEYFEDDLRTWHQRLAAKKALDAS